MSIGSNTENRIKAFLTPKELADLLIVSVPTVYRLVEKRQIPFYKIGGGLRFKLEDFETFRIEPIR